MADTLLGRRFATAVFISHSRNAFVPRSLQSDQQNEKAVSDFSLTAFGTTGRDGGIRTRDPLHPMQRSDF
ncbi:hypothetical protein [Achromobacter xylosoxidans]|uniref:hypothetical protein n=1 Tax=Alcaligenes xylosoxydans xylosoxydans TaxID=85698 RepID=UPI00117734CA|nr:hypothetical protein [Achromobacter xylosoxidans]